MYFPYLRGKQFELLALKEICPYLKPSNKIHPIIEPVKDSFQALERSLNELCCNNIVPTIILNPKVGDISKTADLIQFASKFNEKNELHIGFILDDEFAISKAYHTIERNFDSYVPVTIICSNEDIDRIELTNFISDFNVVYSLLDLDEITSRSFKRMFSTETKVSLSDPFPKAERNADYAKKHDALLTEDHIYYKEEGFVGFSDFLTVGKDYQESGFLPYAVAIHITYPAKNNEEIRLRHFVSDSNEDDSDVPGKFFEALKKLIEFTDKLSFKTQALKEFKTLYEKEHYPGLGYIKKLSILNHLELVNKLLQ
jgi:hypothetical protein